MKRAQAISFLCIIAAIAIGVLVAYVTMYIKDWTEYAVTISALVVSFATLCVAMITYFSIDEVDSVTSMDGNVLENRHYTVASSALVYRFKDCKDEDAFSQKLLNQVAHPESLGKYGHNWWRSLRRRFAKDGVVKMARTKNIIEFADLIQNFTDHLIWFAYVASTDEMREQQEQLVQSLKKDLAKYERLSNGIQYLLRENINLISCVLSYQGTAQNGLNDCNIDNVRGRMLGNPISQIVYYDYLGLNWKRRAKGIINEMVPLNGQTDFSAPYLKAVEDAFQPQNLTKEGHSEQRKAETYLRHAQICFDKAAEIAEEDILWKGYITYNKARTDIQYRLIGGGGNPDGLGQKNLAGLREEIEEAVRARRDVVVLYSSESGEGYLQKQFEKELGYAENLQRQWALFASER